MAVTYHFFLDLIFNLFDLASKLHLKCLAHDDIRQPFFHHPRCPRCGFKTSPTSQSVLLKWPAQQNQSARQNPIPDRGGTVRVTKRSRLLTSCNALPLPVVAKA